jgi:phosphatidylinositol alpha-1,6-mannosyltransferase
LRAEAIGADPARSETVPYGVDAARFAPSAETRAAVRRELGLGADTPLVFTAGRLVSKKGFEYLIDAARTLATNMPALRVAIAGDGDLRDALAARAGGAAQILWLGRQPQDRIGRLSAAADVIAVPSIRDEAGNVDGLPNFALEALASATPVVASTAGGLPQAIVDGVTGRLVPERDAAALAAAISELLGQPETARRMGAAARDAVTRNFGWARVAERFEAAYNRPGSPGRD